MPYPWILFCPQLPATPSSPRVTVWRRLRAAGAVGIDNGLWVLPDNPTSTQILQEIRQYIENQNGGSKSFRASALDADTETEILERFREDRGEEYAEINEQCADFLAEIEKEIARKNFSFAEYEENEQDWLKLEAWLEKVRQRDFLGDMQAASALAALETCRMALQRFEDEVFQHEKPASTPNKRSSADGAPDHSASG